MPAPDVFVSYSRVHDNLVSKLTQILSIGGRLIFRDVESVRPGVEWEKTIFDSLNKARIVVVVWCSHANKSEWVRREAELANELNKEIIPVLLDGTPLLHCLTKYQWIDLRNEINHHWFFWPLPIDRSIMILILLLFVGWCGFAWLAFPDEFNPFDIAIVAAVLILTVLFVYLNSANADLDSMFQMDKLPKVPSGNDRPEQIDDLFSNRVMRRIRVIDQQLS